MNELLWYLLIALLAVNAGLSLAFFRFAKRPESQSISWLYIALSMTVFVVLAALVGTVSPAGPARGDAGLPASVLFIATWLFSYMGFKRLLRRRGAEGK